MSDATTTARLVAHLERIVPRYTSYPTAPHFGSAVDAESPRIDAGDLATSRGVALSAEDRLRRDVIERLMCDLEVDLAEVAARHGRTARAFRSELKALGSYEREGLVALEGDRIKVDAAARPVIRHIAAHFDTYPGADRSQN